MTQLGSHSTACPDQTERSGPIDALRLLVVAHSHPRLSMGGAEIAAYENYSQASSHTGVEAWFMAANGQASGGRPQVGLHQPFGPREFLYTGTVFDHFKLSNPDPAFETQFGRVLKQVRPDIVHFHHFLGVGLEALSYVRRYAPAARVVFTAHEYLAICHHYGQMVRKPDLGLCHEATPQGCARCFREDGLDQKAFFLRKLWIQRFLREADLVLCPSDFMRERLTAWGIDPSRTTVVDNLVPARHRARPVQPARAGGTLRVGVFGQLSRLKGLEVTMRAAALLQAREAPVVIEIHGSADSQPERVREEVAELLASQPANVIYRGPYRNEDVEQLMSAVDVVLVPSIWWENSPMVVQEAASAGTAVLASDIGGLAEKARRVRGGRTFRTGDPVDLAAQLEALQACEPDCADAATWHAAESGIEPLLSLYRELRRDLTDLGERPGTAGGENSSHEARRMH